MGLRRIFSRAVNFLIKSDTRSGIDILKSRGVKIGNGCEIYDGVSFGSEPYMISIGNHVRITKGVEFVTHDGGVWVLRHMKNLPDIDLFGTIEVGNNVHIGMNSVIMPGVKIGDNSIIGCGAVVTKDVPCGEIWGGVPAKCIKTVEEYYMQHEEEFDNTKQFSAEEKRSYLEKKYQL